MNMNSSFQYSNSIRTFALWVLEQLDGFNWVYWFSPSLALQDQIHESFPGSPVARRRQQETIETCLLWGGNNVSSDVFSYYGFHAEAEIKNLFIFSQLFSD